MIKLHITLDSNYKVTSNVAGSLNQFSNAEIVVHLPAAQVGTLYYAWVTPGNLNIGERTLGRDEEEDYDENDFAYSAQIYPGMTLGLTSQQDTGFALMRVRLGNTLSPLIKIPVLKSLAPADTEMPPTELEQINERLDTIEEELQGDFVAVAIENVYEEIEDLDQQDAIYVARAGIGKYITANNMLGGIENNINTLNYEASVGTTIAEPTWARTWYDPIEQIEGNTVVENEPTVLEQMNFTDEGPEVNLMAAMLDETVNSQEQIIGLSEGEVSAPNVEGETELAPGVSETEYNPYG